MVSIVLDKTGAIVRARGVLYKEVVQMVLLYWSEIWMIMEEIMKLL